MSRRGAEHRTEVSRGLNGTYMAYCVKDCGWCGHSHGHRVLAERDGEEHETTVARYEP